MIVVVTVAGLGALAGLVAGTVAWRWSAVDPAAPHVGRRSIRRYLREHPVARRLAQRHHPSPRRRRWRCSARRPRSWPSAQSPPAPCC